MIANGSLKQFIGYLFMRNPLVINKLERIMKEKRVYVIPEYVRSEKDWQDYLGIDVNEVDYDLISDNVWMEIAEKEGWVYTLEGFVKAWNVDNRFPSRLHSSARIIEVEY